jgi:hypothetical protein
MADKTQKPLSKAIKRTQINYTTWCRDSHMHEALHEMKLNLFLKNVPAAHKRNTEQTAHKVRGL